MKVRPTAWKLCFFFLSLTMIIAAASFVWAEVREHPLIRPFPGSTLGENMCKYKDFDEYTFTVVDPATNKEVKQAVRGKFWYLLYTLYTPDGK